jgi:hypothetical protein
MLKKPRLILAIVTIFMVMGLVTLVVIEKAYRSNHYEKLMGLMDAKTVYSFTTTSAPLYQYDEVAGYSYVPDADVKFRFYSSDNQFIRESSCRVNNMGHLDPRDYTIEKPPNEYRIACIGDSFTGTPQNEVQWSVALMDVCNDDEEMKQLTDKSFFRTYNLGLDGTGFVQWPRVYEGKAKQYQPDLVIVNIYFDDPLRNFMYRATLPIKSDLGKYSVMVASNSEPVDFSNYDVRYGISIITDPSTLDDPDRAAAIKREIYKARIDGLPWKGFGLHCLSGLFEKHSLLDPKWSPNPRFPSEEEAIKASVEAVRELKRLHPHMIVLSHPSIQECKNGEPSPIVAKFQEALGEDVPIIMMLDYLPLDKGEEEIKRWYNLPHDEHPSDYGCELYGKAVRDRVAEYLKSL